MRDGRRGQSRSFSTERVAIMGGILGVSVALNFVLLLLLLQPSSRCLGDDPGQVIFADNVIEEKPFNEPSLQLVETVTEPQRQEDSEKSTRRISTLRSSRAFPTDLEKRVSLEDLERRANSSWVKSKNFVWRILETLHEPELLLEQRNIEEAETSDELMKEVWTSLEQLELTYGVSLIKHEDVNRTLYSMPGELPREVREKRVVYFITPTYRRPTQVLDLIRVSSFLQIANLREIGLVYWIVVEDGVGCTRRVRRLLERSGLPFAHLSVTSKKIRMRNKKEPPHRGVDQRNKAVSFIQRYTQADGVIYFGDDDNAYDPQLITELSSVKTTGVNMVGFAGGGLYERCVVNGETGLVERLVSNYDLTRQYPIDMGGFALSTWLFLSKPSRFHFIWGAGQLETKFISKFAENMQDLKPLNGNCTRTLAWHVKTSGAVEEPVLHDNSTAYEIIKRLTG